MNKAGLLFIIFLGLASGTFAQRQNQYFFKDNGARVSLRDSADYLRIVQEPEQGTKLYKVNEYYLDGTEKSSGLSKTIDPPLYQGAFISYYKNGNKRVVGNYIDGVLRDSVDTYYPNGKLYTRMVWSGKPGQNLLGETYIHTVMDSTGRVLVQNGDGEAIFYNADFNEIAEQGKVKNGTCDGIWTGGDKKSGIQFEETYENGKLLSGESRDAFGVVYPYTKKESHPEFKGGINQFYKYLGRKIQYPKGAQRRGIEGIVYVRFVVKKDGALKDIRVMNFLDAELSAEAVRVMAQSPAWIPGVQRGMPVNVLYNIPISFSLGR
ncbi:hypothetical protein DBR43_17855 [Pedobacter sp. KBW06]|uniref:energy transducer TonB n=1 Tax=Pedobacter sp. KBW06 TaxID=2153359 RepID=UPI000F5969DE|nr:energy transducer TonB [Pedobacter sp. KBW06]RQO69915.1 hypothetical protein DBR43_17855 [Pedobacter sp. KBW06]